MIGVRKQIIETIEKEKLIVIVRGVKRENLIPLAQAMYDGGIRLLEVTFSANGSVSDEETAENIKMLSEEFKNRMFIGAGTVLTKKQVELTYKAGGSFIISPNVSKEVIKKTRRLGMVSMPGALTPTEAQNAHNFGADFVKLFPITSFGADYVKAVKAPLSHIKYLAVGGICENNMEEYLKAGISGFGVGGNIVNNKLIEEGSFGLIKENAEKYVKVVRGWQTI